MGESELVIILCRKNTGAEIVLAVTVQGLVGKHARESYEDEMTHLREKD